nr:MAG TPA: hypothetical protein [Caudoviricetes sp.]
MSEKELTDVLDETIGSVESPECYAIKQTEHGRVHCPITRETYEELSLRIERNESLPDSISDVYDTRGLMS